MKNYHRPLINAGFVIAFSLCSLFVSANEIWKMNTNYPFGNYTAAQLHGWQFSLDTNSVITFPATEITYHSATCSGKITTEPTTKIIDKGICWSLTSERDNKSIKNKKNYISAGAGAADYACKLIDLNPGTTYYAKAYFINNNDTIWGNEIIIKTIKARIGQELKGGVIAYLLQPGNFGYQANVQHGLIVSPETRNSLSKWESRPLSKPVCGTRYELGTGAENTQIIITNHGLSGYYAAKICYDYKSDGYTDWFLPSKDELYKIYLNRAAIGIFVRGFYWSSTEDGQNVFILNFGNGVGQFGKAKKSARHWVRPVRYF